jgi:monoamine oxidase
VIGSAAAGAAAVGLPAAEAKARRTRRVRSADVVVIGAGLAGLSAARRLVRAGRSVLVLEARDRVGGRILNHPIGAGEVIEVGGQWVGPTQDHVLALARELGVKTFLTYNQGQNIYYRRDEPPATRRRRYDSTGPLGPIPPDTPAAIGELAVVLADLDAKARQVPRAAPWTAAQAAEWDGQTFETYKLAKTTAPGARFLLDVSAQAVFAAEPRDVSLLFVLLYIACAGNDANPGTLERLINTPGGAQESRIRGGSQRIAIELARRLGKRVILDAPVHRIVQKGGGVVVQTDAVEVRARRAIVAMAPAMTAKIEFAPNVPGDRAQLIQRFPMGSVIKCQAIYDRPFWRDDNLTGQAIGDVDPVRVTFDNSPPDGNPGVLLGFIEGQQARIWGRRSRSVRRAAVLESLTAYFGPQAASPRRYVEKNWTDEVWTRGCYEGFTPPGVLLDYGRALRAPFRRIHWAGTETATWWTGYMDGAVESGQRAAAEVLSRL